MEEKDVESLTPQQCEREIREIQAAGSEHPYFDKFHPLHGDAVEYVTKLHQRAFPSEDKPHDRSEEL
ncbi:MAG: hypothetical protein GTN76_08450 [Candidatus Aenigmarchaeota archaeon]|nr:hypothetical protein [Candidatus Aenigmarchaeota archaeon]